MVDNIEQPIDSVIKFCGASMSAFNASLGWNDSSGQLYVELAEDDIAGDLFTNPIPGTPLYFTAGNFTFGGILQNRRKRLSTSGFIYTLIVSDPRFLLASYKVVVGGYHGPVNDTFPNLISAVYYFENGSYGLAGTNEAGMLWDNGNGLGVKHALLAKVNGVKPITFKGYSYTLDISNLPSPPPVYRIQGDVVSILDIIDEICRDGGHDYFVKLEGTVIKVYTVSRRTQPTLGRIEALANQKYAETLIENEVGLELRPEDTNFILFGGPQRSVIEKQVYPYWGQDVDGEPIINSSFNNDDTITLNATSVSDILGETTYSATIAELRFALVDENSWQTYIGFATEKRNVARQLGLWFGNGEDIQNLFDAQHWKIKNAEDTKSDYNRLLSATINSSDSQINKANRVYQMVASYAKEYYGRKFWVEIPGAVKSIDIESGQTQWNIEPVEAGYADVPPLDLPEVIADLYTEQNGLYRPFVKFTNVSEADTTQFNSPEIFSPDGSTLYVPCSIDSSNMIRYNGMYGVILTVSTPIFKRIANPRLDNISEISTLLNINSSVLNKFSKNLQLNLPYFMHPSVSYPTMAAIPIQNNTTLYGPFYKQGAEGGTSFRIDQSLVPWNYGGRTFMEAAANAMLSNIDTAQQLEETGTMSLVGVPVISLGEALIAGGPTVTGMRIDAGTNGWVTTYEMRTYTPRAGAFSKQTADRIQRLQSSAQQTNRLLRQKNRAEKPWTVPYQDYILKRNIVPALDSKTPGSVLVGSYDEEDGNTCYVTVQKAQEAKGKVAISEGNAAISLDGVFRPFSVDTENTKITTFEEVAAADTRVTVYGAGFNVDVSDITPFLYPSDFGFLTTGTDEDTFDVNTRAEEYDATKCRGIGVRSPVILVGWGYTISGKTTQQLAEEEGEEDGGIRPLGWKAGPLDVRWDEVRKVWCNPGIIDGIAQTNIPAGSSGLLRDGNTDYLVWNIFSTQIAKNTKIAAGYNPGKSKILLLAVDC